MCPRIKVKMSMCFAQTLGLNNHRNIAWILYYLLHPEVSSVNFAICDEISQFCRSFYNGGQ